MRSVVVFPAPFGPSRPEDLAAFDTQRQVVDGELTVPEALGQAGDLQGNADQVGGDHIVRRAAGDEED